jgi:phage portal protein BeeE
MLGGVFQREAPLEHRESVWSQFDTNAARSQSTWSGQVVTTTSALQLLAVYGSVTLITDQISTLPIDTFRKTGDVPVEITKPAWLVEPTVDLGFPEWCSQLLMSLLLAGNAYIVVTRNPAGAIVELVPLDPERVKPFREDGRLKRHLPRRVGAHPWPHAAWFRCWPVADRVRPPDDRPGC